MVNASEKGERLQAGLGGKGLVSGPATTFDFDNDGLADLAVTTESGPLLLRNTKGGFANMAQVHAWNMEFVAGSPEGKRHTPDRCRDITGPQRAEEKGRE